MIDLRLFGGFELLRSDGEAPIRLGAKPLGLLAYLAMSAGVSVPRGRLAGLLWGDRDEEKARHSLSQALLTIRRALGPTSSRLIQAAVGGVVLEEASIDLDVKRFELLANSDDIENLLEARDLYRGKFLEGLDLSEPDFEEWMLGERYRLDEKAATAFSKLLDMQVSAGSREEAVDTARELISVTPLDEAAHARLIALFAALNRRGLAESHYKRCRDLFRRELNRNPGNEIEDAIKSVREYEPRNDQYPIPNHLFSERKLSTLQTTDRTELISINRAIANDEADGLVMAERPSVSHWGLHPVLMAAGITLFTVVGGLVWWQPWAPNSELASPEMMVLPLPDKPSLAVLPFANLSSDPNQEVFVDGLTEDLITDLSKISGLFVIARNSTSVYKDTPVEIRTVAETLGVRYVLEGSVRRDGDQLRVNAQLIDATTGGHLWADRYDREVTNIFSVQDEFVLKIVEALAVELSESEKSEINLGKTDNAEAREAFQRGRELYSKFNAHDNARAEGHLLKAIELDPEFGRAHAALALVYYRGYRFNWQQEMGESWNSLRKLTADRLKIAKQHPTGLVHVVAALEYVNRGIADLALMEAEQAIAMQPNDPEAHIALAFAMIISGRPWEGLSSVKTAKRLNPRFPSSYVFAQGIAHFAIGNLEEAAITLEEGHERDPKAVELLPVLASIYAQLERRQDARDTVLKWRPGLSQLELQFLPDEHQFPIRWSLEHGRIRERLIDGLRVAVLPQSTTVSSLLGELEVATPFDRAATIRTLGWFGPSAAVAVPDLIRALSGEQQQTRVEAANTLGKIGPEARAAIPVLVAISDDDIIVSFHAKEALREIIGN